MSDLQLWITLAVMGALLVLPWGRRIVKVIFGLAIGLFLLLLLGEPRLD